MNITGRIGYYFRRASIDYNALYQGSNGHADFVRRWNNAGDESRTNVPALPLPADAGAVTHIYSNSNILVEKGDHIRLQDIRLDYDLKNPVIKRIGVQNLRIYAYLNNAGILWKATKHDVDPDYGLMRASRTLAFGVNVSF